MNPQNIHITTLFHSYLKGNYSVEELDELLDYFQLDDAHADQLKGLIEQQFKEGDFVDVGSDQVQGIVVDMHRNLMQDIRPRVRKLPVWRWAAAVLIFVSIGVGLHRYIQISTAISQDEKIDSTPTLLPGGNRATITLEDGRTIELREDQDGIQVGQLLTYEDGSLVSSITQGAYATMTTPKGGQYRLKLPDGTQVWLNAESSLKYPVVFDGAVRQVELSGEAYFEVSHQDNQPFIVETAAQRLTVLGTVFNIAAYSDDTRTTTTLVSGKVSLGSTNTGGKPTTLNPGQQAVLTGREVTVSPVDAEEATAWKSGKFIFNDTDIYAVMRQLARWYDAEVIYTDRLSDVTFSGSISRYEDIKDVLRKIELTQSMTINVEGRRIVVSKK